MESRQSDLWRLFRAIASRDSTETLRLLAASPRLATASAPVGATRQDATSYYVAAVGHHVYEGDTALHIAAAAYRSEIARELIARGADPRARNRRGAEPLDYATVGQPGSTRWDPDAQAALIEYLVSAGADPNSVDRSGARPLHRAVRTRCAAAVGALLAHGADPRGRNRSGSTPLHLAVQATGRGGSGSQDAHEQQARIVTLLIDGGARTDDRDGRGRSVTECARGDRVRALLQSVGGSSV